MDPTDELFTSEHNRHAVNKIIIDENLSVL